MELTKAQQTVVDGINKAGGTMELEAAKSKFDSRAVNNLVKKGALKEEGGKVIALFKTEAKAEKSEKAAEKVAKSPKKEKASDTKKNTGTAKCLCGCGTENKKGRKFAQGHDASLRSRVLKYARGKGERSAFPKSNEVMEYLAGAHWMTPEIQDILNGKASAKAS